MSITVRHKFNLCYLRKILRVISLLILLTLVFSCFTSMFTIASPFAMGATNKIVNNETELRNAVNTAAGSTVIALNRDITLTGTLYISANKDVTLTSNNNNNIFYKLIGATTYPTIMVNSGGLLRLEGIIVTHAVDYFGVGVGIFPDGTLIMSDGEISGNNNGGIHIYGGTFNLSGGVITNNTANSGGGVKGESGGSFVMSGGVISGNTATSASTFRGGGGGVSMSSAGGSFVMSGGEISSNNAVYGGGVYIANSAPFVMSGGVIYGNTATELGGGVYNMGGTFTMSGGEITYNTAASGGGVSNHGDFSMSGGSSVISNNNAVNGDGGGVYNWGSFVMSGDGSGMIFNNKAGRDGGGVWNYRDDFIMPDDKNVIYGNTASRGNNVFPDIYYRITPYAITIASLIILVILLKITFYFLKRSKQSKNKVIQ